MSAILQQSRFLDLDNLDDGPAIDIPPEAHTLAGFRRWVLSPAVPEKLPVTYLRGHVVLDMSKEEINSHALVKSEVGRTLRNVNEELDFGHLFINGVLVVNEDADVANNPDIVAVSWNSLETGLVRYTRNADRLVELVGTPDMVTEIISRSSVRKDKRELRQAYHKAKIPEYWLIDARGKEIDFQILHWRKNSYGAVAAKEGWLWSRVFERFFKLTRKTDRSGSWKYTLAVKGAN